MSDEADAYLAISRLHATYADYATRKDWSAMRHIVVPDARLTFVFGEGESVTVTGADELAAFGRRATAAFDFYSYEPLNFVLLSLEPGTTTVRTSTDATATGRFYAHEIATLRDTGQWVEFYGAYDDEYVVGEGRWRFATRTFRTRAHRAS
jgi:hypothetical protein